MYTIEKNVPLPRKPALYPFEQMEVGDSFFVPRGSVVVNTIASRVYTATRNFYRNGGEGKMYTIRSDETGVRCWRVS